VEFLWTAFLLGNGSILTNACLLPLYPGLIAFLAGNAQNERAQRASGWLGLLVLAGVLTLMLVIALVIFLFGQLVSFNSLFPVLLPVIYGVVIVLGLLMLLGKNPFERLAVSQSPTLQNPYLSAYLYGVMLGPMTLPCTGPTIVAALSVGVLGGAGDLFNQVLFFLVFGLGFGWPLVLLPLVARGAQKRFTAWLGRNHALLARISGVLLIAIGIYGYATEVFQVL
jgi:cytochrome c-type biogenesis protein